MLAITRSVTFATVHINRVHLTTTTGKMCCQRKGKKSVLIICFVLIFCFSSKAHIKCILYFNHLPPVLHISLFMYACIDVVRNAYGKMFRYKDVCVLVQHFQCCQLTMWKGGITFANLKFSLGLTV